MLTTLVNAHVREPNNGRRRPYFVTVRTTVAEWLVPPPVAFTKSVKAPVFGPLDTTRIDVPEVSDDGDKVHVGPTGLLLTERVTTPVKAAEGRTLSVKLAVVFRRTD